MQFNRYRNIQGIGERGRYPCLMVVSSKFASQLNQSLIYFDRSTQSMIQMTVIAHDKCIGYVFSLRREYPEREINLLHSLTESNFICINIVFAAKSVLFIDSMRKK